MLETVQLDKKQHDRKGFDCGVDVLNDYLAKYASSSDQRSLTKTFVLVDSEQPKKIIGFYTLAYATVSVPDGFPRLANYPYPAPALTLARMAIDKSFKKHRFGEQLLLECIRKTALSAQPDNPAAVIGLFVDAKEDAVGFYKQYGFIEVSCENTRKLYLPITTCKKVALAMENGET
ncbi:GNAT family N-acetyltransferase [Neptuniibacter sp. 1_MG-2023]|uniref:GNAT family N-acetyltransferase n=1 Tax=Neptuniibacter sp. 1_MG-2023 TaxID=3062662 RepID=UPI0026E1D4B2|nr:GNAT family N-acetyltransferase [Neptuniibacter sp. 1_MG-2023]MDO6594109.1 GNAT family N-acetyltransferase [Neptuniibacter sp. 1_MG-2023]